MSQIILSTITERIAIAQTLAAPNIKFVSEKTGRRRLSALRRDGDRALSRACAQLTDQIEKRGHRFIGSGSQRNVFTNGPRAVVKTPTSGLSDRFGVSANARANVSEVLAYESASSGFPVAVCRLLWHESGLPVVIMERVREWDCDRDGELPEWADLIDGEQVGWSRLLRTPVAYDAGIASMGFYDDETYAGRRGTFADMDERWNRRLARQRQQQLRAA